MYLTTHAALGALIGSQIQNPLWAFILGVLSHLLLDLIPHHSTKWLATQFTKTSSLFNRFLVEALLDNLLVLILILVFGFNNLFAKNPLGLAGGLCGAILPDILMGFFIIFPIPRIGTGYLNFNHRLHLVIKRFPSDRLSLLLQMALSAIFILLLFWVH